MKIEIIDDKGTLTEPKAFYPPLSAAARRSCRSVLPIIASGCLFAAAVAAVFSGEFIGVCLFVVAAVLTAVSVISLKISASPLSRSTHAALPSALSGVFLIAACAAEAIAEKSGVSFEAPGLSLSFGKQEPNFGLTLAVLLFAVGLIFTATGISNIDRSLVKNIPTSVPLPLAFFIEGLVTVGIAFLCFADKLQVKFGISNMLSVGSKERLTGLWLAVSAALLFTHMLISFIRIRKVKKCCFQNRNTNI